MNSIEIYAITYIHVVSLWCVVYSIEKVIYTLKAWVRYNAGMNFYIMGLLDFHSDYKSII